MSDYVAYSLGFVVSFSQVGIMGPNRDAHLGTSEEVRRMAVRVALYLTGLGAVLFVVSRLL